MWKTLKIIKNGTNWVWMPPFGLRIGQSRSQKLWGASGTPPGLQKPQKINKNAGFRGLGGQGAIPAYLPLKAVSNKVNNPKLWLSDDKLLWELESLPLS